ncbi:MAG: peptidase domain-containing ABC transporter [Pseudomonadales bacterium]|nr:peptidase domain-containing ABC transporter [Pseudomonadales bacterium]
MLVLTTPLYIQTVVDNVVVTRDREFLWILGIGFLLLLLFRLITQAFRSWVILYLRSTLGIQLVTNLFRHLLHLPMDWFGKRAVGDILTRLGSLDYIKNQVSEGLVEGVIDGVMAILTLTMMFIFSAKLAAITLVAVTLYVLIRNLLYNLVRARTKENIQLKGRSNTLFYEVVRTVQPIKIFNGEAISQAKLENTNADLINSDIKLGRLTITKTTVNELIYGAEYILVIWIGALSVINEEITIGVLFGFIAYRQQFATSSQTLLDKFFAWRMMSLHLSRVADIVLEDEEEHLESEMEVGDRFKGQLALKGVSYRYHSQEPFLFRNLSLSIEQGECVCIVAPSGYGKTTLMKVMMGLMQPSEGKIYLDGMDITRIGMKNYRRMVSAVMQGDTLLGGSIADNITFFAIERDQELMEECARQAQVYEDIMSMPMGFSSLAGDLGSTLSGGQVQRVLIARALYKRPKILFLDEASSALDIPTEKKINEVLSNLGITRIMIAHRKETILMADRIIRLQELALGASQLDSPETDQGDAVKSRPLKLLKPKYSTEMVSGAGDRNDENE